MDVHEEVELGLVVLRNHHIQLLVHSQRHYVAFSWRLSCKKLVFHPSLEIVIKNDEVKGAAASRYGKALVICLLRKKSDCTNPR